jgi:hypothetical protein
LWTSTMQTSTVEQTRRMTNSLAPIAGSGLRPCCKSSTHTINQSIAVCTQHIGNEEKHSLWAYYAPLLSSHNHASLGLWHSV